MLKLKKLLLRLKTYIRDIFSVLLCNQTCMICSVELSLALPVCESCLKTRIEEALLFRIEHPEEFCQNCSRRLISEKELCTKCRSTLESETESENKSKNNLSNSNSMKFCDKIFAIYPYQDKFGEALIRWKNFNEKVFAELFAKLVFEFLQKNELLSDIAIVPVPPRPKKMKDKGWDQIEDLSKDLECFYDVKILRLLGRKDGIAQKSLSSELRKTNLKGKIYLKDSKIAVPKTLIILDDVMTTGATLNSCAEVLKLSGCEHVYGLCLFFD